jgi:hypothetical protein
MRYDKIMGIKELYPRYTLTYLISPSARDVKEVCSVNMDACVKLKINVVVKLLIKTKSTLQN